MQTINRPTAVLVIAILQFVFGGLGLLGDLCGGLSQAGSGMFPAGRGTQAQMEKDMTRNLEAAMEKRLPNHKAFTMGLLVLDLALCGLMIGGGVGLIKMQPWGRTLTIIYALFSLVMKIVNVAMAALVTAPATKEAMAGMTAGMGREAALVGQIMEITMGIAIWMPVCLCIYPIVVLVIMLQPHVVAAFAEAKTGPSLGAATPPDYQQPFSPGAGMPPDDRYRLPDADVPPDPPYRSPGADVPPDDRFRQ
jgi:hypothetical protein